MFKYLDQESPEGMGGNIGCGHPPKKWET